MRKLNKIQELVKKTGVDEILIYNGEEPSLELNFFYLTQLFDSGLFEESYLIGDSDESTILTSRLEEFSAKKSGLNVSVYKDGKERTAKISELTKKAGKIGINMDYFSVSAFNKLKENLKDKEFVDISKAIQELRMVKEPKELNILREAAKIASESVEAILKDLKEGVKEYEIAALLTYTMLKNGASDNAFTPIIAFGKNSAEPHYFAGAVKLKKGDFVLMDFGARYQKYNSDMTRTYVFGRANDAQKEMYETVLTAQKIGIENARAGRLGKDIDGAVRNYIDSTKYKGLFIHSLGHGIGLATHDHPGFAPGYDLQTKENMVITVEPGVYQPGFGGVRIEDDVILKQDGCEVITTANKELTEL